MIVKLTTREGVKIPSFYSDRLIVGSSSGDFCSSCCLPLSPQRACSLHATWNSLFLRALHISKPKPKGLTMPDIEPRTTTIATTHPFSFGFISVSSSIPGKLPAAMQTAAGPKRLSAAALAAAAAAILVAAKLSRY